MARTTTKKKEKKERRVGEIISPSGRYFDELKNTF
jgi:hypothetical protein